MIDLSLEDLALAHEAIGSAITATETILARLMTLSTRLDPDIFDELIGEIRERLAALRRVSDALFDAELELRFPTS